MTAGPPNPSGWTACPEFFPETLGRSGSRLTTTAGKEATVTVAGVTRLEARRLEVSRGGSRVPLCLLDVAPVLRGRSAGAGEPSTVAVLQPGEGADRVGVGWTAGGLAVAGDLSGEC